MKDHFSKKAMFGGLLCLFVLAVASVLAADDPPQFGPWSAPVNLGPVVNTGFFEQNPAISKDGLSLYFQSDMPGGYGQADIYVSQRASVHDPWGPPQNLGPNINTASNELAPNLSTDGHKLYFHSNRPGGFGGADIYVSRRANKRDDLGWQPPENLGSGVNTASQEQQPCVFEDEETGVVTLYFISNRPGGMGDLDIYASTLQPDETFGATAPVVELNSSFIDRGPTIRRDGLEIIFPSNRPGSIQGYEDLWVSTRAKTSDPWSTPVNLGSTVNSMFIDSGPELSFDGTTLYFNSSPTREVAGDNEDLWVTTRTKLRAHDSDDERNENDRSRDQGRETKHYQQ